MAIFRVNVLCLFSGFLQIPKSNQKLSTSAITKIDQPRKIFPRNKSKIDPFSPHKISLNTSEIGCQTESHQNQTQTSFAPVKKSSFDFRVLKRSETNLSDSEYQSNITQPTNLNLTWTPVINPKRQDKFKHCPLELICEMARPSMSYMHELKEIFLAFQKWLTPLLEISTGLYFSKILHGGHLFTNLVHKHVFDKNQTLPASVKLFLYSPDLPKAGYKTWLPSLLKSLNIILQNILIDGKIEHLHDIHGSTEISNSAEEKFSNPIPDLFTQVKIADDSQIMVTKNSVRLYLKTVMFNIEVFFKLEIFVAYDWNFGKENVSEEKNLERLKFTSKADSIINEMSAKFLKFIHRKKGLGPGTKKLQENDLSPLLFETINSVLNSSLMQKDANLSHQKLDLSHSGNANTYLKNQKIFDQIVAKNFDQNQYSVLLVDKKLHFIENLDKKVIDLARFLTMWRDGFTWDANLEVTRPCSFSLLLLVCRSFENCNINLESVNISFKHLFQELYDLVNNKNYQNTPICWNLYYNFDRDIG